MQFDRHLGSSAAVYIKCIRGVIPDVVSANDIDGDDTKRRLSLSTATPVMIRDDNIIDCPLDGAKEWSRSRRMAIMLGSGVYSPWKRGHLVNIFRCDVSVEIIEMIGYLEITWYANLPYPGTSVIGPLRNALWIR